MTYSYYKLNKEERLAYQRKYYENQTDEERERRLAYLREYYKQNKEQLIEQRRKYKESKGIVSKQRVKKEKPIVVKKTRVKQEHIVIEPRPTIIPPVSYGRISGTLSFD
jgi:hypothetical protein